MTELPVFSLRHSKGQRHVLMNREGILKELGNGYELVGTGAEGAMTDIGMKRSA